MVAGGVVAGGVVAGGMVTGGVVAYFCVVVRIFWRSEVTLRKGSVLRATSLLLCCRA